MEFRKFIPICKIDAAKREVYGIVTSEVVDKDGEICDYASTAPNYKAWSEEFEKATQGKSLGNVREMHANKAAGKVITLDFDDTARRIMIGAKIVDDEAWKKCEEGVYTGFSHGGSYEKVWQDGAHKRYTAKPSEVSLVDNPCNPEAHFEYVKTDGTVEVRKFTTTESTEHTEAKVKTTPQDGSVSLSVPSVPSVDRAAVSSVVEKREVSDKEREHLADEGHAMPDGSYPIANESDLRNAIQAFGRAKDKEAVRAHIIRRAKQLGRTDLLPADWSPQHAKIARAGDPDWPGSTKKSDQRSAIGDQPEGTGDREQGREGNPEEKHLRRPESANNAEESRRDDGGADMEKVGAKFSAETRGTLKEMQDHHGALHDIHKAMGEHHAALVGLHGQEADHHEAIRKCFGKLFGDGADDDDDAPEAEKTVKSLSHPSGEDPATVGHPAEPAGPGGELAKLTAERELQKRVTELEGELQQMADVLKQANEQLAKLLAEPRPAKAIAKAVAIGKDEDAAGTRTAKLIGKASASGDKDVLKACLAQPL
jgi:hypothetical protein